MKTKSFNTVLLTILLATAQPLQAGFFDSIWSGVKSFGSWIRENKKTSLLIASSLLGAGLYTYWKKKKNKTEPEESKGDKSSPGLKKTVVKPPACLIDAVPEQYQASQIKTLPEIKISKPQTIFEHEQAATLSSINNDNTLLLTVLGNIIEIRDLTDNKVLSRFGTQAPITSALFTPKAPWTIMFVADYKAIKWDPQNKEDAIVLESKSIISAMLHSDGIHMLFQYPGAFKIGDDVYNIQSDLITASHDFSYTLVKANDNNYIQKKDSNAYNLIKWSIPGNIACAAFNNKNSHILFGIGDTAHLLNINNIESTKQKSWDDFSHNGIPVTAVAFSKNDALILTTADNTVFIWDAKTGNLIASFAHNKPVTSASFCYNDSYILTTSGTQTRLWKIPKALDPQKFNTEQKALVWLLRKYHKEHQQVTFDALVEAYAHKEITVNMLKCTFETFSQNEQDALIKMFNIVGL